MTADMMAIAKAFGQVEEREESALEYLCQAAEQELQSRLKQGVTREDCGAAFDLAGAWIALAGLVAARNAGETVESFTAGEVSLKAKQGERDEPAHLRRQAEQLMKPFLKEDGFCFLGVKA